MVDSNASNVVSYWYSDFGEVTEAKGTNYSDFVNEIQYTGAIYDKLSGLTYLNARFYDASTGRFITQDSYRGERNDADTWHLYLYCANDPINYVDPSGHLKIHRNWIGYPLDIALSIISSGTYTSIRFLLAETEDIIKEGLKSSLKEGIKSFSKKASKKNKYVAKLLNKAKNFIEKVKKFQSNVRDILDKVNKRLPTTLKRIVNNRKYRKSLDTGLKTFFSNKTQDFVVGYLKTIIDLKDLDCLFSVGGFTAGYLDYYLDDSLDGYINV